MPELRILKAYISGERIFELMNSQVFLFCFCAAIIVISGVIGLVGSSRGNTDKYTGWLGLLMFLVVIFMVSYYVLHLGYGRD